MLKTVTRLFHPLVSLTWGSGIKAKAIQSRERRCTNPLDFFVRKKVPSGLWSNARIVNKTTARSLHVGSCSLHNSYFSSFHIYVNTGKRCRIWNYERLYEENMTDEIKVQLQRKKNNCTQKQQVKKKTDCKRCRDEDPVIFWALHSSF